MTQMLLFDAPATNHTLAGAAVVANSAAPTVSAARTKTQVRAENRDHKAGLNHMGDLARLVLLRYELAAKRRTEMAARRAK